MKVELRTLRAAERHGDLEVAQGRGRDATAPPDLADGGTAARTNPGSQAPQLRPCRDRVRHGTVVYRTVSPTCRKNLRPSHVLAEPPTYLRLRRAASTH